ncbi:MAG: CocE/NonD family hydrolase [Candidatus Dormibacteraeota bacterium]|nr:CocE/NonD family hydrolase [Candidatus Dormibacteraeota bacterium]
MAVVTGTVVQTEFDVPVPMRDGTILRANVYRPAGEGRWPVLLTRLPYGKDLPLATGAFDPVQAARRGYVVIIQDTRGRFRSEGDWYPFAAEREDGYDTVEWAASLPYGTGEVGMYGGSYFGFTQWAAAGEQPRGLKTLVPMITWRRPDNGLVTRGGALELGTAEGWNMQMGADVLLRRHPDDRQAFGAAFHGLLDDYDRLGTSGYWRLPLRGGNALMRSGVAPYFQDLVSGDPEVEKKVANVLSQVGVVERVELPTFSIGGWYDIFLQDTLDNHGVQAALGRPAKVLIGPWSHGGTMNPVGERNFGFGAQAALIDRRMDLQSMQLRWFDHWLYGRDTGMLEEPPVQIFVMGINRWRGEEEWPLRRAVVTPHYLHAGGRLDRSEPAAGEVPDHFDYDPAEPVPTVGGALLMVPEFPPGPRDQRRLEERDDVLVYTSEVLGQDVEVTGPITAHIWLSSSAPDTDLVVRLCDVLPDGTSYNLTDGILRGRYRNADLGEAPSLLPPGDPVEFRVDLWSTSNVFLKGHRIRIHVTSSSFPRWDRNPNTGHEPFADAELSVAHQTVLHDQAHPSRILLPVVPPA